MLAWARDGTDFRPSINGVGGAFGSRRTVCESSRERWRDGEGCYRTLGFRPPRVLHAYWCGRDGTDFRPSINGGATGGRAQLASVSASDGAPALAVCRPSDSAHTDGLHTYILVRCDRRDRFSTIEKRRCDCAGGRAQAVGVSASDGAPAQPVCRLPRFGILALQHAPIACTHEQLSSLHLNEDAVSPGFFFSQDRFHGQWGGLPVNVEHVSHAVCIHAPDRARPPRATNLDPWH